MILIDYNAIAISNVVAQRLEVDEDLIRHMILNSLRMYRTKFKQEYGELVICCDGRRNWRKAAFPQYKWKRKQDREESGFDWEALFSIIEGVKADLRENFPYKVIEVDTCEADDIIAQIAIQTQEFGMYEPVMIVSGDKDFAQLQVMDNVKQFSNMTKKYVKEENPRQFLLEHILRGDGGDGIPNVLSPDDIFVRGERQSRMTAKRMTECVDPEFLAENPEIHERIKRNTRLIDLTCTPKSIVEEIINNFNDDTKDNRGDGSKVMRYLMEKRCRRLLECIEEFVK